MIMNDSPTPRGPNRGSDTRYLIIAGVLLVVIIVSLSVLWVRERRARFEAQCRAAELKLDNDRLQDVMGKILISNSARAVRPIRREDLPARTIDIAGTPRRLLQISPEAGGRFGFAPGDLIEVSPESAPPATQTAPATAPAGPQ